MAVAEGGLTNDAGSGTTYSYASADRTAINGLETKAHNINNSQHNGEISNMHAYQNAVGGAMPIAICGMAVRLPGGVASPEQFWDFLYNKGDGRCRVPESRYNVSSFYSDTKKGGTVNTEYGCFLDDSVDLGAIDASFFTMTRAELEQVDPQQRMLLEVARECFEDAGMTKWRGKTIGCYIGTFGEDWLEMSVRDPQAYGVYRLGGYGDYIMSNRVSYEMDLRGPSMTIRTACSSSLVALNEACMAVQRGDCEAALVGGANLIIGPGMSTVIAEQGVLSPDGSCKSFSEDANGYARGEAVASILVKPLSHAIRDGNPIRAVIRATTANVDGKTPTISAPSTTAHEAMIRKAYEIAGINDFSQTAMVECHGTGTPTGDPIEANAVARVFGEAGVYIGSVKPNVGHSEGASGLVSVIKSVLALEHRTLLPNIRFKAPNPAIPFESAKLKVPIEPTPWPTGRHERISVNSFGIGGANAHAILDSAASFGAAKRVSGTTEGPQLLVFSANSAKSLTKMTKNFQQFVESSPDSVGNLAYTLATRREHLPHRTFAICTDGVMSSLANTGKAGAKPNLVMAFTGQGAQWPQMGQELLRKDPTFRNTIRSLDQYLQTLKEPSSYSIEQELLKPGRKSLIGKAELSQPLCTAVQIALIDTLAQFGVMPDAVVGHSSGEIAAAYAAGALTAQEAIVTSHFRGAVVRKQSKSGAMAAIGMGWADAESFLIPNVSIACDNSPKSVTISGDTEQVRRVMTEIQKSRPEVMTKLLQVDKAYHSHHMAEVSDHYESTIDQKIIGKVPTKPFFSSVTGNLLADDETLDARYWRTNMESPVRFNEAVTAITKHKTGRHAVFVEIGPHSALAGPLRQIFIQASSSAQYVAAMVRNRDATESLLNAIGKLHILNVPINFEVLVPNGTCLSGLPRYPWNHEGTFWFETRVTKEWRSRKHAHHDLLGLRVSESSEIEPMWRNLLHLHNVPWLRDHKVGDDIVFPFAGYIAVAGEAIKQLSGVEQGFSLRNINVSTALILPEGRPTEIVTTCRPKRLTTSLNSDWWEFTVTAFNGHAWIKHSTGEVTPLSSELSPVGESEGLLRQVRPRNWYDTMRKAGLDLGPAFQNLESVETSTGSEKKAVGKITNGKQGDESNYHIHPSVIDGTIQLVGAAAINGYARKFKNRLPTTIEQLDIVQCSSNMVSTVSAKETGNSAVVGDGYCVSEGNTVVRMRGLRLSLAEGSISTMADDDHAAGRKEWGPDLDFMDINSLISLPIDRDQYSSLNDLYRLCLLSSSRSSALDQTQPEHVSKYKSWIKSQTEKEKFSPIEMLDNDKILIQIQNLMQQLSSTSAATAANAIYQIFVNFDDLMRGKLLEEVLVNDLLADLFQFINNCDRSKFLQHFSHFKPNGRILEIGTGKGVLMDEIIKDLTLDSGKICCSKYTLTTTAFVSAEYHKKPFGAMEYISLDTSEDLSDQDFTGRQYDLILATNGFHSDPSLHNRLLNIKRLLHPEGRLLIQQISSPPAWFKYVMGVSSEFWISSDDQRPEEPYNDGLRLKSELSAAGFGDTEALIQDQHTTVIIAKSSVFRKSRSRITVLCSNQSDPAADQIMESLDREGYGLDIIRLGDPLPVGQDIISILDLKSPFFHEIGAHDYQAFKEFVNSVGTSGVMWVTGLCQMGCKDPRYGQALGLIRNIRTERSLHFATCEVDDFQTRTDQIVNIFNKFHLREDNDTLQPDFEYCVDNGVINIGRVYPISLNAELLASESTDKVALDIGTPGRLNTLHWSQQAVQRELQGEQIELEVYAVGLNFKDILVGMGVLELPERVFGGESTGIVRRTGPDVVKLKVGDRVACIDSKAFTTLLTTTESFCCKIPGALTFEEAATMIIPYVTSIYSLVEIGRLRKNESVLIHSACGGVGIAAIHIARYLGAEIYTTVSSEEKVKFLIEQHGIPRKRIFYSRDASFVDGVMEETQGRGVDVVLNSLSGELLHATWACVAEFGRMVEIGKRDLIGGGKLDMTPFLLNRTYSFVDVDNFRRIPGMPKSKLEEVFEYYASGAIGPVQPIRVFDAASTAEAFLTMAKGFHIGRFAVSMRDAGGSVRLNNEIVKRPLRLTFAKSASYLLIGGLGGLGRAISRWMAENHASELIYLSRSAGVGSTDQMFVKEMHSMGCDIKLVRGSVNELSDVTRAIQSATYPLKGVIQMSMVINDANFAHMTYEQWIATVTTKVQGTWNLHDATIAAGIELDFFVLLSSLSGIFGQHGQANYASANTFLDAFSQYRKGLGLAASAIQLGAVQDVGFLESNQDLLELLRKIGFKSVSEQHLIDAMTLAIEPQPARSVNTRSSRFVDGNSLLIGVGSSLPLTDPDNRALWKDHRSMAAYHNESGESTSSAKSSNETLKSYLATVRADTSLLRGPEAANVLANEIGKKLFDLLLKSDEEINIALPLVDLGLDSIVALELRAWWKQVFLFDISVLEMLGMGSLQVLGQHAASGLLDIVAQEGKRSLSG